MSRTTDELVEEVRDQLDENNTANVTDAQLVAALNRGQRKATNILARKYDEMFWDSKTVTTVAGQRDYELPPEAFGRRVEKIEVQTSSTAPASEVRRIHNHKRTPFITTTQTQRPTHYALKKNKIQLFPEPTGGLVLRIHFTRRPEKLVLQQGRITSIDTSSVYVLVDTIGSSVTTDTTSGYGAWLNVIDYQTGHIKRTLQVLSTDSDTGQISFKTSSLTRATVLGHTVGDDLDDVSLADGVEDGDLQVDDYVCLVTGTCVPELDEAYADYLVQYAVVEIRRRFGEPIQDELIALKELKEELVSAWAGREQSHRIRKSNPHFSSRPGNLRRLLT